MPQRVLKKNKRSGCSRKRMVNHRLACLLAPASQRHCKVHWAWKETWSGRGLQVQSVACLLISQQNEDFLIQKPLTDIKKLA
jgi:ribonuclease HI